MKVLYIVTIDSTLTIKIIVSTIANSYFNFIVFLGYLEVNDISVDLIERCFYSLICKETEGSFSKNRKQSCPDLLIRTSGESRLSDFLLWQSSYSVTHFTDVLWPNFGLHHLMGSIFYYQSKTFYISEILNQSGSKMDKTVSNSEINLEKNLGSKRIIRFLELLEYSKISFVRNSEFCKKLRQDDDAFRGVLSNI